MTTLAITGAAPGLGAAIAARFGRGGFSVVLISRSQEKLDALSARPSIGRRLAGRLWEIYTQCGRFRRPVGADAA
ncbi:MAG: SDR family NAD(P)-dependent oxidoreductase [Cellulosimicrobium cellulans]